MLVLSLLFGCQELPASGDPLSPAIVERAAPGPASAEVDTGVPAAEPKPGAFDFEADATEGAEAELLEDPIALLAAQQGVEIPPDEFFDPAGQGQELSLAIPASLPDASVDWGLRLVSTVHNVQPPRAILGLPDGTEVIVTAGAILADQRAIVMAIGDQQIEIAWITPNGYQAKIETERITALYPE